MIWVVISLLVLFLAGVSFLSTSTGSFKSQPGDVYDTLANELVWAYDRQNGSKFRGHYDKMKNLLEEVKGAENQGRPDKASYKLKQALKCYNKQVREQANSAVVELSVVAIIKHMLEHNYAVPSKLNALNDQVRESLKRAEKFLEDKERYDPAVNTYYNSLHQTK